MRNAGLTKESPEADISPYHILSQLGASGMGEPYLAQDTKLDRKVALKILPTGLASDQQRIRRFVREAKAASALNHPTTITIHEIDRTDSIQFIATEDNLLISRLSGSMKTVNEESLDLWVMGCY